MKFKIRYSLYVTIIYLVVGGLWIYFSDILVSSLTDVEWIYTEIQTLKGWFFILVTGALLFILISNYERRLSKKIKLQRAANDDLRLFLYKSSHILKGPVATILGLTTLGYNESETKKLKYIFQQIESTANKTDALISEELAKLTGIIESKTLIKRIDFNQIASRLLSDLNSKTKDGSITFISEIEDVNLFSDENFLTIAIGNILENAILHSNDGESHEVVINVEKFKKGAKVRISDTGKGIGKEQLNRIFEMFYKGSYASEGSGLGLYISRLALKKIEGEIFVESVEGKGTDFIIILPDLRKEEFTEIDPVS